MWIYQYKRKGCHQTKTQCLGIVNKKRTQKSRFCPQVCQPWLWQDLFFPLNPKTNNHEVRNKEVFKVNKCHTDSDRKYAIPTLEIKQNLHHDKINELKIRAWHYMCTLRELGLSGYMVYVFIGVLVYLCTLELLYLCTRCRAVLQTLLWFIN